MSSALLKRQFTRAFTPSNGCSSRAQRRGVPLCHMAPHRMQTRAVDPTSTEAAASPEEDVPMSESARKAAEAARLRAAEKFMTIGSGEASCTGCGYEYLPSRGDPEFPVAKGTQFQELPADYICPVCGASKDKFEARVKEIAGFAENQGYGLGTNSWTGEQKQLLIYGSLLLLFAALLSGYALN